MGEVREDPLNRREVGVSPIVITRFEHLGHPAASDSAKDPIPVNGLWNRVVHRNPCRIFMDQEWTRSAARSVSLSLAAIWLRPAAACR